MSDLDNQSSRTDQNDSFNVPVKKSPLFMFALMQIPLLILMVVMLYFLYQSQKG
jgi:hypothetical protein